MGTLNQAGIVSELTNFNDSPLIICQRILKQISENISLLYYSNDKDKIVLQNELIFQDKSILLFGFMRLYLEKIDSSHELRIKFVRPVNPYIHEKHIVLTLQEKNILYQELVNYLFLMEFFNSKFDDSINIEMIRQVVNQVEQMIKSGQNDNQYWLIPYQNKVERQYDKTAPIKNADIWNKYSYILRIKIKKNPNRSDTLVYQIWKVYDNNLDKTKSISNLRFLEEDLVQEGPLRKDCIYKFVYNLFFYGELIND